MNVTQKYTPSSDGNGRVKDKLKARLVGGGDCQDHNLNSRVDTSSPTASTSSILIIAQLAATERRPRMPKDDPYELVFMAIAPIIANILTDIDPSYKEFLRPNGTIVVELDQALYGCIESALLWYKKISSFLASIRFVKLVYCPTKFMMADIVTKPLQGSLFRTMWDRIIGIVPCPMTVQ